MVLAGKSFGEYLSVMKIPTLILFVWGFVLFVVKMFLDLIPLLGGVLGFFVGFLGSTVFGGLLGFFLALWCGRKIVKERNGTLVNALLVGLLFGLLTSILNFGILILWEAAHWVLSLIGLTVMSTVQAGSGGSFMDYFVQGGLGTLIQTGGRLFLSVLFIPLNMVLGALSAVVGGLIAGGK